MEKMPAILGEANAGKGGNPRKHSKKDNLAGFLGFANATF
jgi:hypothetical protein